MSFKQLPSSISTDDLLKQLETVKEEVKKKTRKSSDLLEFLTTFNIEPGIIRVERKILYRLYKQYSNKPLSDAAFYRRLANYIKMEKNFFYVNQKQVDISERVLNLLKPAHREQTRVVPLQMHFQNFIKKFNLKAGKKPNTIWVSAKTLYDLYDEWTYGIRKKTPLNYRQFTKFCTIYFPINKQTTGKIWISLDDSIFELIKARNSFKNEEKESPK